MAISKERKILMAVAGTACAIFLADRVLTGGSLGGPTDASASVAGVSTPPAGVEQGVVDTSVSAFAGGVELHANEKPIPSLAQRLADAGRDLPPTTPDAFAPSGVWQKPAAPPTPTPVAAPTPVSFDARGFANGHRLDAVFLGSESSHAMVNGRALRLGDERQGMTLVEIGDRWVVWAGHGMRLKVHLDTRR